MAVAYRSSTTSSNNATCSIPAGSAVDDWWIGVIAYEYTVPSGAAPSGWSLLADASIGTFGLRVVAKKVVSGDLSGSVSFGANTSAFSAWCSTLSAFSGAGSLSDIIVSSITTTAASDTTITTPSVTTTSADALVLRIVEGTWGNRANEMSGATFRIGEEVSDEPAAAGAGAGLWTEPGPGTPSAAGTRDLTYNGGSNYYPRIAVTISLQVQAPLTGNFPVVRQFSSGVITISRPFASGDTVFSGPVIFSGHIASGQVNQFNLASGVVNSGHIASGQIGSFHLASGSVLSGSIASGQIGRFHLASGSVASGAIASGQIGQFHIASGLIASGHIGNNVVVSGSIASGQVGSFHLASGHVVSGHVGNASVLSGSIASGQIGQFHLASGLIVSGHIGNASVLSGSIASGQIGQFHLSSGSVVSGNIGNNAVVSGSIASGQIGANHLASGVIPAGGSLSSGSVVSGHIGNNAVVSGSIASGQIGIFHLGNESVLSGHIGSGQIGVFHLASGAVLSGAIASGQVGLNHIASGAIRSGAIASGQVGLNHIASGAIRSGAIASGQVGSFHLGSGAIRSGTIASGNVGRMHMASGAINSGHIANAAVTSGSIASGAIGTFHLSSGTVVSGHIGNNAVVSGSIASGQVSTPHISSGAITGYHFLSGVLISGTVGTTDNALIRADGTGGRTLQGTGVTVGDADELKIKSSYSDITAPADGATITLDLSTSNVFTPAALGGNRALALSNAKTGQRFALRLLQDATGGRTVTWWSGITWYGANTLVSTANKATWFTFLCTGLGTYDGFPGGGQDVTYDYALSTLTIQGKPLSGNITFKLNEWTAPDGRLQVGATYSSIATPTDGATITFDLSTDNVFMPAALGGNRTLALSNAVTGQRFSIRLKQDGTGSRTVTWWSGISWPGNTPPVLTTNANRWDWFTFVCTGSGTYDGFVSGQNFQ